MRKVTTAEKVVELIPDGATVGLLGFGLAGWAEEVGEAIAKRYQECGHPNNITIVQGSAIGDWKERGVTRLGQKGLVKRWIGAHIGSAAKMSALVAEGGAEGYCLPQGVLLHLYREIAAHRPGLITKIGLGTFVDPRIDGARMNSQTKEDIVRVIKIDGEEYLFYKAFPIDVAIIRGTTVDHNGNLTMEKEGVLLEALPLAQAARNSGGTVIVQAEYLAANGSLHPKDVKVPGILVDHVVIATKAEASWQTEGVYFSPAFSGDLKVSLDSIAELPLDERKIIARRAAMELIPGAVVNLGVGIPSDVGAVAAEEGVSDLMTLTTEAGCIGGVPASLPNFGVAYNPEAVVDAYEQFDFYDGGGVDVAFLGLAQTDEEGNVNVSKFKGRAMGCGGFIDITQSSKKVVYCGSFTAGGLKVAAVDGRLVIEQEGKGNKFIRKVEQITFSGKIAAKTGQAVLYVTERAVFSLENGEVTLIEVAPGISMEKDVLAHMDFVPRVSAKLKLMPAEIFQPRWGGLREIIEANAPAKAPAAFPVAASAVAGSEV